MNTIFFQSKKVLSLLFAHITRVFGDPACESPNGEVWQYFGYENGLHHFRHREYRGQRRYVSFATWEILHRRCEILPTTCRTPDNWTGQRGTIIRFDGRDALINLDSNHDLWMNVSRVRRTN